VVYNSHFDVVNFTVPAVPDGLHWEVLIDTNQPEMFGEEAYPFGAVYAITGRSLVTFGLGRSGPAQSASIR
jgi:glycogen operon protein